MGTEMVKSLKAEMTQLIFVLEHNTTDFMLICEFEDALQDALFAMPTRSGIQHVRYDERNAVVFSNTHCAINGCRETWLMT